MINFILGRSGSGKSKRLREILLHEISLGSNKIIFIVPEQSSFENEKTLLNFLGNKNFSKIKVLSFSRLFDFVSEMLKIPPLKIANEVTQTIMMNEVLEELKSKLNIYKKSSNDMGLAKLILETMRELKSHKIDKNTLKKLYESCSKNILKQKIKEIICISDSYENLFQNTLKDSFDELNALETILKSKKIFEGYLVFFDEFSTFTMQQFSIIETMMVQSKALYMAFCTDKSEYNPDKYSIFSHIDKTIFKIKNIAKSNSVKLGKTELLENTSRFQNSDLKILEKNIFTPEKNSLKLSPENISIYGASDPHDECEYIAQKIKSLIIEKKYCYGDFTILTRDISNYANIFRSVFKRYYIPYFIDSPEKLFNKNLTNLILSAFDAVHSDYSPLEILRYLKSGLTGLSIEEISSLENYILLWNIKSNSWNKDFYLHPEGFYKEFSEAHNNTLEKLNQIRKQIITPLENFKNRIKNSTGKEISRAIYNLLIETNTAENLKEFCDNLEKYEDFQAAEHHALLWDNIMEILNQIALVLGDKRISSQKYLEMLICAIDSVDCAYIPPSMDNVIVADITRTRASDAKIVFVIGVSNGDFPKSPSVSEIFTDEEISHIASLGVEAKDSPENFLVKERFLAYTALTAPSQKLFISWAYTDSLKKSKLPSEIIKEIKLVFPSMKILSRKDFPYENAIFSKSSAFEVYLKNQSSKGNLKSTLKHYLYSDEIYKKKCEVTEKFLDKNHLGFQNPANALSLFNKNITVSASQIEKYYNCSFAYFCEYGLRAKSQTFSDFNSLDYGTLIHFLLEKIFKKYSENKIVDLSSEEITSEIENLLEEYIKQKLGGWENKPKTFSYIIERLKKSMTFLIKHFSEEFKQSKFKILDTEIEISKHGRIKPLELSLPNGRKVFVEGKIDRADIMTHSNANYIRIIDYKTGAKQLKLSDVYYGINMQMLIYLLAIHKNGIKGCKSIVPAAALYFTALKPLLDAQKLRGFESAEKEIRKKLKMNGLILKDPTVILGMEENARGEFIPPTMKDGEIKNSDSLITAPELELIYHHVKKLITHMVTNLSLGKIGANPIYLKNSSVCKWCKYFSICRYEDEKFLKIPTLSNEKILEKMEGKDEIDGK